MSEKVPIQNYRVKKFWNTVSKLFGNPNLTMNSPALLRIKQYAVKYFNPGDTVLDFGCGPGDITVEIAKKTKHVYAVDLSEGMVKAGVQKAKEQNIENVKFLNTDLFDRSFQNTSFDVITAFNVLQYIQDKNELYQKIHELIKPQGLFISTTACLRERHSPLRFLLSGLTLLGIVPKIIFYKTAELENEIKKAGFTIIETSDLPERFIVAKKD